MQVTNLLNNPGFDDGHFQQDGKATLTVPTGWKLFYLDNMAFPGIGGGVAEVVGQKLRSLARFHQVICITHLPQMARFGKRHFKIAKRIYGGRTRTTITPLRGEARVKELARMLGGVKITKKTLDHAREMMVGRENRYRVF